jgi:type III restriction enzyme
VTGERAKFQTQVQHKTYSVDEVAELMFNRLKSIDEESKDAKDPKDRTHYAKKFPLERCRQIVRESLRRRKIKTGLVTEDNRQKFLQALGTLRRRKAKRVVYKLKANALVTLSTTERQAESCSAAELRRGDKTVFYPPGCDVTLPDEQVEFFREIDDPDGEFRAGREAIANSHDFKTPLNLAIADALPERKFIRFLCNRPNVSKLDGWVKNTPQKFYWIEYAWKKGEHPKRGEFSPDFFINQKAWIFVVETKGDEEIADPSPENQKKYEYAMEHFERLNEWLSRAGSSMRYQCNFLTPKDFNRFFQLLRNEDLVGFQSRLDIVYKNLAAAGR